jgi:hypothetical protein
VRKFSHWKAFAPALAQAAMFGLNVGIRGTY